MRRPLLLVALASSIAHAAPAPKAKDAVWFPTKEGDTRVYEVRSGDKVEGVYTDVVTKTEKKDAALHVTVRREFERHAPYITTIAMANDGLFRVASDGRALDKPILLLKTPPKVGAKWELDGGARYAVTKEEEVEVPAGKFKAVRVEQVNGDTATTLWFAPTVGVVKMSVAGSNAVTVLKEFKAGK
ncbi:MAG: hypothetical protein J2P46_19575 [Zavarzinella sp.]|nr:hypothetical protein [Zavarzinella sp.]